MRCYPMMLPLHEIVVLRCVPKAGDVGFTIVRNADDILFPDPTFDINVGLAALHRLVERGLVAKSPGRGTFSRTDAGQKELEHSRRILNGIAEKVRWE